MFLLAPPVHVHAPAKPELNAQQHSGAGECATVEVEITAQDAAEARHSSRTILRRREHTRVVKEAGVPVGDGGLTVQSARCVPIRAGDRRVRN